MNCPLISSIFCKRKLEKEAFFDDKSAFICGIKNWFVPNRFDLELRSWKIQFWILHCRSAKPRSKCERKKTCFISFSNSWSDDNKSLGCRKRVRPGEGGRGVRPTPQILSPSPDFWPPRYNSPPPRFSDIRHPCEVVGVTPLLSNVDLDKLLHAWKILFFW